MKKMTAKAGIAIMLLASLTSTSAFAAPTQNSKEINLIINSVPVNNGAKPIIKNGRTLAPIRIISESLGASVDWDKATQKVTVTKGSDIIEMTINKPQVKVNGKTSVLEQAPILHSNSTMLPLRFIGESLGCLVEWDSKTRTVTVTSSDATVDTPDFAEDKWGRKIRTTNLPNNAGIFPYVVEGVPNWVYEQINMKNVALISETGVSSNPKQLYSGEKENDSLDYDKMVNILNNYFETILNIDYRTFNEKEFVDFAVKTYHPNGYPKNWDGVTDVESAARVYAKYIKDNKMVVSGEFQVLPEMFWENNMDTHVVSAWVKLTVHQQGPKGSGSFQTFGTVTGGKLPRLEAGKTYEGLVQFRMTDYKVDYNTCGVTSQISLDNNIYGGAKKTNNPY